MIDLERRNFEGISALGIFDGDNSRFKVPRSQIALLRQEAERRAVLYPEQDAEDDPDFSSCEMDVEAKVEADIVGKKSLVFAVTNKSDTAVPRV